MLLHLDAELAGRLIAQMKKGWAARILCIARRLPPPRDRLRRDARGRDRRERVVGCSQLARDRHRHRDCPRAPPQGLGTAVGAALTLECLVRGIDPLWLASNETSCRLATKLGYTRGDSYETFEIAAGLP